MPHATRCRPDAAAFTLRPPMTLLLVRHGETALNVARTLQPPDTPLSPRGHAQALSIAQRLRAWPVRAVLSSPLPRAHDTALAIAAATGAPVVLADALQERHFGDWRGRPYDTLPCDPLTMADAAPGGETEAEFLARADDAWDAVCQAQAAHGGALVVVTHGLVLRAWLVRRLAGGADAGRLHLGNTSLTVCGVSPPHAVETLACTAHLDGMASDDRHALVGG